MEVRRSKFLVYLFSVLIYQNYKNVSHRPVVPSPRANYVRLVYLEMTNQNLG